MAENLEARELLSALVSGTDLNGDKWTLKLVGPGTLNVSRPDGTTFTADNQNTPALIGTITVSGTNSSASRLLGTVTKRGPTGDGRVFFQNLRATGGELLPPVDPQTPSGQLKPLSVQNGILAISMPDFWLGHTNPTAPASGASPGAIDVPDGVATLNFGGVDTTFTPPGGAPLNKDGQSDRFNVNLGLPFAIGTSIIVNRVITDAQASTTATGSPTQDSVFFNVTGRLNLFQANQIDGNSTLVPDQFADIDKTGTTTPGGTYVISEGGAVTGAIGDVRVGGNATNFTALAIENAINATPLDPQQDAKVGNFSIGGETNNVILVAPGGARDVYFGKGMDTVKINALLIHQLQANRGALNSTVTITRGIDHINFGGDVVNTNVQVGYAQGLNAIAGGTPTGNPFSTNNGVAQGRAVPTIINRVSDARGTFTPLAQNEGHLKATIAGSVINSVFSASIEPNPTYIAANNPGTISQPTSKKFPFGEPDNIIYPHGLINVKVEGKIDNSNNPLVVSTQPNTAFFAKTVHLATGPVQPPVVPEAPYPGPTIYHKGQRGVPHVGTDGDLAGLTHHHTSSHPTGKTAHKHAHGKKKA